ncbi:hypothetical protein B0H10DRAFT_812365 [Mycena sp. CBHHK59/15]|nr:hypothetical protein B0H10DRAFT_812365 [Mycena sp. CBHHK59/15]
MAPETYYDYDHDEVCPDYNVAVSRSNTTTTTNTTSSGGSGSTGSSGSGSSSVHWRSPFDEPRLLRSATSHAHLRSAASHTLLRTNSLAPRSTPPLRTRLPERYVYTYSMVAAGAPLDFIISVESSSGRPTPGKYTLRLSLKVADVERPIGEPVVLRLSVDPRSLNFVVFLFPGKKAVLPLGCLYSLRVWLRANGVDHRIFGEDELWVGKDPDFTALADASFARLRSVSHDAQVYDAVVGRARIQFVVRWQHLGERLYRYTMEYDAAGVGTSLIDDLRLILDGDPRKLTFLIYTVPIKSAPAGASHRLRIWLKSPAPLPANALPFSDAYVYQRVWKSDTFKLGARLDFAALGPALVMGVSAGAPRTVPMTQQLRAPETPVGYQQDTKTHL